MGCVEISPPLIAVLYETGADAAPLMQRVVASLSAANVACAGFVQRDVERPGRSRCDIILEDVSSGDRLPISEDRGTGARGCHLDEAKLFEAMACAIKQLDSRIEVLVLNKFGKSEAEGRGFRPLIAAAIERGVTVIVPVPWRNVESWRQFAGELSSEHDLGGFAGLSDADILRALGITVAPVASGGLGLSV